MKEKNCWIDSQKDKWLKLIDILQNDLNLDVYPGGFSGMTGWHHRHDWIFHPTTEYLYGIDIDKIPNELLKQKKWERDFFLFNSSYFPKNLGIDRVKTRGYALRIPSLERSLLEMIDMIGHDLSIDTVHEYFGDLGWLNPKLTQKLLENCTSEKIKRIALFLMEEISPEYYAEIDPSKVKLNLSKKIDLVSEGYTGNYTFKYNITTPAYLELDFCEHERFYKERKRATRAV